MTLCAHERVHAQAAAPNTAASRQAGNEYLEAGKAAYGAGRLDEALRNYERAYELLKAPRTLFRIGDVADKLGMRVRAVSAYQQYLDSVPTTSDRARVLARIRANRAAAPATARQAASSAPVVQVQTVAAAPVARKRAVDPPPTQQTTPAHLEVAASAPADTTQPAAAPDAATAPMSDRKSRVSAWWIVAGVSVLAVGGIIAAAFAMGSSAARQPTPIQGNVGGTVQTLGAP
jgi:tetratricopeptide (TPR) repeat protein